MLDQDSNNGAPSYEQESAIANQLAHVLSVRRGKTFSRTVIVTSDCRGGNIDVSYNQVLIDPFFFTEGNPIATMEHVLDVCEEFDLLRERRTLAAIMDLKHRLRHCVRELRRIDPSSLQKIIDEELGSEEETLELKGIE